MTDNKENILVEIEEKLKNRIEALEEAISPYEKRRIQEQIDGLKLIQIAYAELSKLVGSSHFIKLIKDDRGYTLYFGEDLLICFSSYRLDTKYGFRINFDKNIHNTIRSVVQKHNIDSMPNQITIGKATSKKILAWLDYAKKIKEQAKNEQETNDKIHSEFLVKVSKIPGAVSKMFDNSLKSGYVDSPKGEFTFSWSIIDGSDHIEQKLIINGGSYGNQALDLFLKLSTGGF